MHLRDEVILHPYRLRPCTGTQWVRDRWLNGDNIPVFRCQHDLISVGGRNTFECVMSMAMDELKFLVFRRPDAPDVESMSVRASGVLLPCFSRRLCLAFNLSSVFSIEHI